jgi:hypothetical protein
MNKILLIFLFVAGLIAYVNAAYVVVNVGGLKGENIFIPQTVFANVGDNVNIIIMLCHLFLRRAFEFYKKSAER